MGIEYSVLGDLRGDSTGKCYSKRDRGQAENDNVRLLAAVVTQQLQNVKEQIDQIEV